jgi:D-glycero-alpha-D-manno-heptose-7-phosphate kinase
MSARELADEAIHIEQEVLAEPVGCQDQIVAAHGGFNRIRFFQDGHYEISPLVIPSERYEGLQDHLMLFFTGISRYSAPVSKSQIDNFSNRETELMALSDMVDDSLEILRSTTTPLMEFGNLLHEAWQIKRRLSDKVSNGAIDEMYAAAREAGAIGGKITGAGGGGFLLLFVPPAHQIKVRERLSRLIHVPFRFERTGTQIVLYQPNGF